MNRNLPAAEGATPAMAQWFAAKAAHPDALVFFRLGDFFEMFFDDAILAGEVLGLATSHRGEHNGRPIPMAGVPAHAHEAYLARLLRRGYRVALCDQMETPEQAKARKASTIRREVVRVVTPGTVTEDSLLEGGRPSWLLALAEGGGTHGGERLGAAWLDISTGMVCTESVPPAEAATLLSRLEPAEILAPPALVASGALAGCGERLRETVPPRDPARIACAAWEVASLDGFGAFSEEEVAALAMALDYVRATQGGTLPRLSPPECCGESRLLRMDAATRRSLEILRSERGDAESCLFAAVDRTLTGAGGRELAARLAAPLAEPEPIRERHEAVEFLLGDSRLRAALRQGLRGAPDMQRALARLSVGRFFPRDLAAMAEGLGRAESIRQALDRSEGVPLLLLRAAKALLPEHSPRAELARALAEELPSRFEDGNAIATGYDGQLDGLRRLRDGAREAILEMQRELARAWGVASLKIKHHQQFGHLVEVPSAAGETLLRAKAMEGPHAPIHRQTMANAYRFTCTALAELDRKLSSAREEAARREARVVAHLRQLCLDAAPGIAAAATALAEIDVQQAAAELAAGGGWCRPEIAEGTGFRVRGARHPVVDAALRKARGPAFVPNDADLSPGRRLCLLTGPNMAGKSTFLRQNALLVVLAQAGLFAPAEEARIGLVDRLFSRVGAADDIAGGRSTFMVEMSETAVILNQAGPRSLVILDEVGRGTATWDGLAIAWAVLEALHDRLRCRAIFATHFHELTALSGKLPDLAPARMEVREHRGRVVFLHTVAPGASERSWGLHVARLAGVPRAVVARAESVLAALEARAKGLDPLEEELPLLRAARPAPGASAPQHFSPGVAWDEGFHPEPEPAASDKALRESLEAMDLDAMSPREALEALYRLKSLAGAAEMTVKPPLPILSSR
ncbi:DNA mismatch repair protein MutS [Roseomonas gilardii]|uniref:DNA mismatch repair protein MutS n=1 Tax=Roseomonas gilardii TaxID=257708 RepID=UPI0004809522|nr:DNA mismatch repair protein MutS [Roseomonas gilardii]SUE42996.1 DNA mismatch repair protein mutS [Roseomonas gilardii subsp. rosea]